MAIHTFISGRSKLLTSNDINTCIDLGMGISWQTCSVKFEQANITSKIQISLDASAQCYLCKSSIYVTHMFIEWGCALTPSGLCANFSQ